MEVSKARQYLPFLKRAGRQRGVVEYEFSASKLKIFVPKESCQIALSLAALKAPQRTEPFAKEALTFVRDLCHQHDVEFEVLAQDRGGSFIGNVWVNKKNLATSVLEQGLAEVHRGSVKDSDHSTEYIIAEDGAKRAKKNKWKNYDEAAEQEERNKRRAEADERKPKQEFPDVVVTEVLDGVRFYIQTIGPEAEQLDELMKNLAVETSDEPYNPKVGELVKAQFVDDAWYRARVKKATPEKEYDVFYVDYGNSETLPASRIRPLDASFNELPPQAKEAQLAYIKTPSLEEEYGTDAAVFLRDLVAGKPMMANLEYKDTDRVFLSLVDRESQVFVNAALLRAGLARVERVRGKHVQPLIEKLKEEEDKARSAHLYIWEYGDPGFDDEEEKGVEKKPAPKSKGKEEKK
jgi:staphylococcal nuclease domain-containing protein 1